MLADSKIGLHVVTKVRNQCELVIARAHGRENGCDPERNGEARWVRSVSDGLQRVVDVGANRGEWTSMVLQEKRLDGALLFEPSLSAIEMLREQFSTHPEVEIVTAAAGGAPGTMSFFEEQNAGQTSSFFDDFSAGGSAREVSVTTIDVEVERRGWPSVDFLKIDAEGYDFHVLEGARTLFEKGKISYGQFEYNSPWRFSGSTLTCATRWLKALGYQCFVLKPDGLERPNVDVYREYFLYSNYAIVRNDLVESALQKFARMDRSKPATVLRPA
jgi:FkbM family methyltransferase